MSDDYGAIKYADLTKAGPQGCLLLRFHKVLAHKDIMLIGVSAMMQLDSVSQAEPVAPCSCTAAVWMHQQQQWPQHYLHRTVNSSLHGMDTFRRRMKSLVQTLYSEWYTDFKDSTALACALFYNQSIASDCEAAKQLSMLPLWRLHTVGSDQTARQYILYQKLMVQVSRP